MKFIIEKKIFIDALNTVSRVIPSHHSNENFKAIKIECFSDKMILKTTDSLISMEYYIEQEKDNHIILTIIEEGETLIPARNFLDIIKKLPTDAIQISIENKNMNIISGQSEFNMPTYDAQEFYELPSVSRDKKISINSKIFNNIAKETIFCTAQNEQRPVLEGVNMVLNEKKLIATATDSHRLSKRKLMLENVENDKTFDIIVPKKSMQDVQKIVETKEQVIDIYYEDNRVAFYLDNMIYRVSLIGGKYPNTDKLIPSQYECTTVVNSRLFRDGVDRVSIVSRDDKNDIVKIFINEDTIKLVSDSKELGRAEEIIDANNELKNATFKIAVSAKFLKDAIDAINSENIIIKFSGELTAFTIEPSDYHREIIQVLLPVRTY